MADNYFPGTDTGDDYGGYSVEHREGLLVGYRYFDSANYKVVRFPFGHGLTYTTFEYSNLRVVVNKDEAKEKSVEVSFALTNSGNVTGTRQESTAFWSWNPDSCLLAVDQYSMSLAFLHFVDLLFSQGNCAGLRTPSTTQ